MKRLTSTLFNLLIILTLFSCNKEEIAPQTGNLTVKFRYANDLSGATYLLFTEGVWASTNRFATALRSGTLPTVSSMANGGEATVEFKDLNAGNYVFVLGNANSWSVQVTAGKTTEVNK
ncbi:hypothetical protein GCM10011375_21820 [Hymenobacter qilianensis]|uniref:Uncharacterized protein n=1 Tax=Hymenobacter qilianensis TaxID=1385715 RepID=A0ACB5PS41_9BACT|nr:hypothetical protein [Hymenobacter qilianensis]GGF66438.1 hypothetical protein GCM10011375_21820 [Hymenobacter qilianensis]